MVYVAQRELQKFVRHDTCSVTEAEQRVIGEHCSQTHCAPMKNAFVAQVAERGVAMDNLYLLANEDLSKDRKGTEHGRKGSAAIYNPLWKMIHFESVGQVSDALS